MALPGLSFLTEAEYYSKLAELLARAKAGDRVAIATMSFEPARPPIQCILEELTKAATRGVRVTMLVDAYPFLIEQGVWPGPLMFQDELPKRLSGIFDVRRAALERLAKAGGAYTILNRPVRRFKSPFAGRSHIKFALINDRVILGGCNLDAANHLDVMVSWEDSGIAEQLHTLATDLLAAKGSVRDVLGDTDKVYEVAPEMKLLVDAGKPGQSGILRAALEIIDQAEQELLFTCQYFPNGSTIRRLVAAHKRGVKVRLIYNNPRKHPQVHNLLHFAVREVQRHGLPRELLRLDTRSDIRFLHAKVVASERQAMIGSHNYVQAGVNFGTAEIALRGREPEFIRLVTASIDNQLIHGGK